MITVQDFATASLATGQTLCAAIKYDDGTFDIVAAVHDKKTGAKWVRIFAHEKNDAHIIRANAWLQSGGATPVVHLPSTRKA